MSTGAALGFGPRPVPQASRPWWCAAALCALGAGLIPACASYGPETLRNGDDEATVVRTMGAASERLAMPGGATRLVYARGPMGRHTWMIDLGTDGRVQRWHQALGESQFANLPPQLTVTELRRTLGPPAQVRRLGEVQVWSYRYPTFECRWFQIDVDAQGQASGGSYGIDPMCDDDRADDRI